MSAPATPGQIPRAPVPPGRVRWAGVDEAGLGPILGPLVFGWSVVDLPSEEVDPWRALRRVIARKPGRDKRRIAVADSKVVFTRNGHGRRRLALAALAFDALTRPGGRPPAGALDFLFGPLQPPAAIVRAHPWYELLRERPFPPDVEPGAVELWSAKIGRALARADITPCETGVRVVPAGELNRSFRRTGSKASTHWEICALVLRHLWERHAAEGPFRVAVDKHGGRDRYGVLLAAAFPDAVVEETEARDGRSSYVLAERLEPGARDLRPRQMSITFCERAEERWFTVALASCLAKYAREITMDAFNDFFGGLQPGLSPTAGYTQDGRRWLEEARVAVAQAALAQRVLVRER